MADENKNHDAVPNESKIRDAADAVRGIVEAVPVYQDALQPAAKEVGTALQTVAKTVRVALAPLAAFVWGYDRIASYLDSKLTEKLNNVPPSRIITPDPSIAGPAIESLRFSAHHSELREMYANLLATAMDKKTAHEAHPAFAEIIRQLSPDEARLISYMSSIAKKYSGKDFAFPFPILDGEVEVEANKEVWFVLPLRHFSTLRTEGGLVHPELFPSYVDNMLRLGLVEITHFLDVLDKESNTLAYFSFHDVDAQAKSEIIKKHEDRVQKNDMGFSRLKKVTDLRFKVDRGVLRFTTLGLQFCHSCVTGSDVKTKKRRKESRKLS